MSYGNRIYNPEYFYAQLLTTVQFCSVFSLFKKTGKVFKRRFSLFVPRIILIVVDYAKITVMKTLLATMTAAKL